MKRLKTIIYWIVAALSVRRAIAMMRNIAFNPLVISNEFRWCLGIDCGNISETYHRNHCIYRRCIG